MTDAETFRRDEGGAWMPADKPESIAERMTNPSERVWCGIRSWTASETNSFQREGGRGLPSEAGEQRRTRLRLELDTSRRQFHTIREEGTAPITGGLVLDLHTITRPDEEVGGHIRHWGPDKHETERNDLMGTVMVRDAFIVRLLQALRASERVSIGLGLKVYKRAIAHSFDEDWMLQDLYVDWEATLPLDYFAVTLSEERTIDASADSTEEKDRVAVTDATLAPAPTDDAAKLLKRLNWMIGLLALVALTLLLRN